MWNEAIAASLRAVSANPPIEVVCEISSLEEPIRGRLRNGAGRTAEFRGWMEFSTALMSVAGDTEQSSTTVNKEDEQ
jgi:hypothetical protein